MFQNLIGMLGSLATLKKSGEKEVVSKPYRYARKIMATSTIPADLPRFKTL